MVRVRFGRVDKKLAAGNCPVVYLYGRADTHSNVRTDVHAFATTAVYGPDMQLPRGTRKEGNSRNYLEHNATMTFGTFASNVSWTVTKNKNVRAECGHREHGPERGGGQLLRRQLLQLHHQERRSEPRRRYDGLGEHR